MTRILEGLNYNSNLLVDDLSFEAQAIENAILDRFCIIFGNKYNTSKYGIVDIVNPSDILASDTNRPCLVYPSPSNPLNINVTAGTVVCPNGCVVANTSVTVDLSLDPKKPYGNLKIGTEYAVFIENIIVDSDPVRLDKSGHSQKLRRVQSTDVINRDLWANLDNKIIYPDSRKENIVLLAKVTVGLDSLGSTVLYFDFSVRSWFSVVDIEHRDKIGTGSPSDLNIHGTSLTDLVSGNFTLYDQTNSFGLVQSRDDYVKGIEGYSWTEEIDQENILTDVTGLVTKESRFGGIGSKYIRLAYFPVNITSFYSKTNKGNGYAFDLIKETNILVLVEPISNSVLLGNPITLDPVVFNLDATQGEEIVIPDWTFSSNEYDRLVVKDYIITSENFVGTVRQGTLTVYKDGTFEDTGSSTKFTWKIKITPEGLVQVCYLSNSFGVDVGVRLVTLYDSLILHYNRVLAVEPSVSVDQSNILSFSQPETSQEIIITEGFSLSKLNNPKIDFDGSGMARDYTIYVKKDGSFFKNPQQIQSIIYLDKITSFVGELYPIFCNIFDLSRISIGLSDAGSSSNLSLTVRVYGTGVDGIILSEDLILTNANRIKLSEKIFTSVLGILIISSEDVGQSAKIQLWAELETEISLKLNKLARVALVQWDGSAVYNIRDLRYLVPTNPNSIITRYTFGADNIGSVSNMCEILGIGDSSSVGNIGATGIRGATGPRGYKGSDYHNYTLTSPLLMQTPNGFNFKAGSNSVGFNWPHSGSSIVWTLPANDGQYGDTLKTDGSGNLVWDYTGNTQTLSGNIYSMSFDPTRTQLYIGGDFIITSPDSEDITYLAMFDGVKFYPVAGTGDYNWAFWLGIETLLYDINRDVLYISGAMPNIYWWDLANPEFLHAFGTNSNSGFRSVTTMALSNNGQDLYIGGFFRQISGTDVVKFARYDTANNTWHSHGDFGTSGYDEFVSAVAVANTRNYIAVGGTFTEVSGDPLIKTAALSITPAITTWAKTSNTEMFDGFNLRSFVYDSSEDNLYAAVSRITSDTASGVAVLPVSFGSFWEIISVDSGYTNVVVFGDDGYLYVGGNFTVLDSDTSQVITNLAALNVVNRTWHKVWNESSTLPEIFSLRFLRLWSYMGDLTTGDYLFIGGASFFSAHRIPFPGLLSTETTPKYGDSPGVTGVQGVTGNMGVVGSTGSIGPRGVTGMAGITGLAPDPNIFLRVDGDTMNGVLEMGSQTEFRLADSDNSNYVGFKAPANITSSKVWTLPSQDGSSGQCLAVSGGNLVWSNP